MDGDSIRCAGAYYGVTGWQSGVAHFAHLGGMIVALVLIIYWRKKGTISNGPLY